MTAAFMQYGPGAGGGQRDERLFPVYTAAAARPQQEGDTRHGLGPANRVACTSSHHPARRCALTCLEIMTSDTAQPEIKPQAKSETFRSHLPAIVAATTGTVLAAFLGSLIGAAGTIVGMVIGSLASGTWSWWAERGIRRSAALAAARAEAIRARGRPLHTSEEAAITQAAAVTVEAAAVSGGNGRPHRRWASPVAFIVAAFIGCAIVVTLLEGAAGKPLSAVVQGKPGHGTTLGGGAVGKAAPASPSPAPSASTTGAGATAPASSTTPSGASSSPAASTAPAATAPSSTAPASSAPNSATPSATPTATG
jgi:hypothetical protein